MVIAIGIYFPSQLQGFSCPALSQINQLDPGYLFRLMYYQKNHYQHGFIDDITRIMYIVHSFLFCVMICAKEAVNTLRLKQNGRHFPDDIFKCIFLNENVWISLKISLKFVPMDRINNIPALVQIMAWRQPLSQPTMVSLLMHICVTGSQWVN